MPPPLSTESNERVRAMVRWLLEVNGGTLPARGTPDKGIDSLADDIANVSIGDLTVNMPEAVKEHVEDLEEDELKELIAQVGRLSVPREDDELPLPESELEAEHEHEPTPPPPPPPPPQDEDGDTTMSDLPTTTTGESVNPNPRCWTTGQPVCGCPAYASPYGGPPDGEPYDDGMDVSCEMDCPVGESEAERATREEYSPCCGLPGCVCTEGKDWEGMGDHPYDPDCLRNDCGCRELSYG
ncbi:hypothetical protein GE09DRAFT_1216061 [Coniochaeta sp. 2T2.1]|nr:hypothetical protein GE09DRAFT_1216061 [Coniochaeta sp. 2T2.1]